MPSDRQLVWFRSDLRIEDHRALAHACRRGPVIGVVVRSRVQWESHDRSTNWLDFWQRGVAALAQSLSTLNIPLIMLDIDRFDDVPAALVAFAKQHGCHTIHFNDEYGIDERRRDQGVVQQARHHEVTIERHTDHVLFRPGDLLTGKGEYYSVYTPFYKAWLRQLTADQLRQDDAPRAQTPLTDISTHILDDLPAAEDTIVRQWPAGESAAQDRLAHFLTRRIQHYADQRDFPAIDGTSQLSPYLALGMISVRQCLNAAASANDGRLGDGHPGITTWINELVWREFYQHILIAAPRVSMHQPFKENTRHLKWLNERTRFKAWCEGRTGYPLVDAAMRQLVATGWMHNRLRMLTATFLSKHLLTDWRWGEAFFMNHLLDGELGANNGGWQWAASTGTDSAPYFRVFNPITQSERFDKEGEFIAKWVPELASVPVKQRHFPDATVRSRCGYPAPIVDHKTARVRAIDAFKALPSDE